MVFTEFKTVEYAKVIICAVIDTALLPIVDILGSVHNKKCIQQYSGTHRRLSKQLERERVREEG